MKARAWLPVLLALFATGCKSAPQIAGVISGSAVGAATGSPALGFAAGVAVDAAAHAGVRYVARTRQQAEQDAIATAASDLNAGEQVSWHINHDIPIGNEHGELRVVRLIDTPLARCKEIMFSVDEGSGEKLKRAWYDATVCHQAEVWKWASAEPAVERWGYLQ